MEKISFKRKFVLVNRKFASKKNQDRIVAVSKEDDCTNIHGVPAIDAAHARGEKYRKTYRLHKEPAGYIFWEVNAKTGINGHHPTVAAAVFAALNHCNVYLQTDEK